jgi:hypothetical protein
MVHDGLDYKRIVHHSGHTEQIIFSPCYMLVNPMMAVASVSVVASFDDVQEQGFADVALLHALAGMLSDNDG